MSDFPRISLRINMQGLANRIKEVIGESKQADDLYEITNSARDPDGQPYFWAVNDGTKIKVANPSKAPKLKLTPRGRVGLMYFFAGGSILGRTTVAPNKPVKMKERAIPKIRKFFTERRKADSPKGPKSRLRWFISVMEDTMDFAVKTLSSLTPTIKDEYYSPGYTSEPGTLKNSYSWHRSGETMLQLEIQTGRAKPIGSSKEKRYTLTQDQIKKKTSGLKKKKAKKLVAKTIKAKKQEGNALWESLGRMSPTRKLGIIPKKRTPGK